MADDFMKNKAFGWNVKLPEKTINQMKTTAQSTVSELWDPIFSFIDDNQNVFSGDISDKIERIQLEMLNTNNLMNGNKTTATRLNIRS